MFIQPDVHHVLFGYLLHVSFAEHASFDFPVINKTFITSLPVSIIVIFTSQVVFHVIVAVCDTAQGPSIGHPFTS
jgi:hypothetical protein